MSASNLLRKARNIRLLPPRNQEFYVLFNELIDTVVETSRKLSELFERGAQGGPEIATEIETYTTKCSRIGESLTELLETAQQPPFNRSEIGEFVDRALRIVRYINHAANRFVVYEIPFSDKEMRELAGIIQEACQHIAQMVKLLPKNRNIESYRRAIDRLETKADEIYHGGLKRRFQEIRMDRVNLQSRIDSASREISNVEILELLTANVEYTRHVAVFFILRQVYAELERAIDSCTDVTAALKRMVAENV